jgi:formylmethanofuran dehydrogenase subunit E
LAYEKKPYKNDATPIMEKALFEPQILKFSSNEEAKKFRWRFYRMRKRHENAEKYKRLECELCGEKLNYLRMAARPEQVPVDLKKE